MGVDLLGHMLVWSPLVQPAEHVALQLLLHLQSTVYASDGRRWISLRLFTVVFDYRQPRNIFS